MKNIHVFLVVFSVFVFTNCIPDLNTNEEKSFLYSGKWQSPLANIKINLEDIIKADTISYIETDDNNILHIIYRNDSLFNQTINSYIKPFKFDKFKSPIIILPNLSPIDFAFNLEGSSDLEINKINIKSGIINWKIKYISGSDADISVKLSFQNSTFENGDPIDLNMDYMAGGESSGSFNLENSILNLSQSKDSNLLKLQLTLDPKEAGIGNKYEIEIYFQDIVFKSVDGYLGKYVLPIPSGSYAINIPTLNKLNAGILFTNPKIQFDISSDFNLPIEFDLNLTSQNLYGNQVDLDIDNILFGTDPNKNNDTFKFDNTTSNISAFLEIIPTQFIYSGNINVNPNGKDTNNLNRIPLNGQINFGLSIDIPLQFSSDSLLIQETLKNINLNKQNNNINFIKEFTLGFRIENGFPFNAKIKFYFYDKDYNIIDSVKTKLLSIPTLDTYGKVIIPYTEDIYVNFTNNQIENLFKTKDIRAIIILNTGNKDVVVNYDNFINVKIGSKVKLDYNLNSL